MKRIAFWLIAVVATLVACEEESLLGENPAPKQDNINIGFVVFYGDSTVKTDSVYVNLNNDRFFIDSIRMMISDINYVQEASGDTVEEAYNFAIFRYPDANETGQRVGLLPSGGYNGRFNIVMGIDSAGFFDFIENPDFDPSRFTSLRRGDGFGYNHFEVYGRYFDITDPFDSIGKLNYHVKIGTYLLADTIRGGTANFSVDNVQDVNLVLICDLRPALSTVPLRLTPEINSNFTDFQDFEQAQAFRDSLKFGIF